MNSTTFNEFKYRAQDGHPSADTTSMRIDEPHLIVQILSVIGFGVFSIVGVALAFTAFWVAGMVLAIVLAWTWAGSRTFGSRRNWKPAARERSINDVAPAVSTHRKSGNSSFDVHRDEMLERLEQESRDFDGFLTRLRDANDATEFDKFMDDRAAKSLEKSIDD